MRRRGKRGPNDSESTGKIGQELPQGQLAPLRPSYADSVPAAKPEAEPETRLDTKPEAEPETRPDTKPASEPTRVVLAEPQGSFRDGADRKEPFESVNAADAADQADDLQGGSLAADMPDTPGTDWADAPSSRTVDDEPAGKLVHETQPDSPSTPPPAAQAASPRAPRGFVVLTIGLPGSGKTTWFKRRAVQPLSSDMLRTILFDDITEQRYQGLVFSTLRSLLRARLIAKMPWNYVDATNLSPHERRQWIKMAKSFGYDVHAVFFDVPFEVCMERNRRRERVVSEDVMQKMAERLRPPSFKEGFAKITVVRVKGSAPSTAVAAADASDASDLNELDGQGEPEQ